MIFRLYRVPLVQIPKYALFSKDSEFQYGGRQFQNGDCSVVDRFQLISGSDNNNTVNRRFVQLYFEVVFCRKCEYRITRVRMTADSTLRHEILCERG